VKASIYTRPDKPQRLVVTQRTGVTTHSNFDTSTHPI
jgi:hypothetical protein